MLRFIPIPLLCLCLFFTACSRKPIDVETQFSAYSDLASVRAFTPDPKKQLGNIPEQALLIKWNIPYIDYKEEAYKLEISIRYGDREEEIYYYTISKRQDSYHFALDQNTYIQKKGIATYRVRLLKEDKVYSEFKHPVWTDILKIDED